ncbi:MAG: stage II sporulation protein M [Nanoarchaeota archaeon]|nr:stage II sporulation protein M [Nanoarchaeota archaeon]
MLESLINPKRAEKGPWKMFFIGILYASLSLLLVKLFFSGDPVLIKYSGWIVVLFCVMFSLPFMYFIIRREEKEDETVEGVWQVWNAHKDAMYAFMWLFLGFVIAFSFWFLVLQESNLLNAQIETYCAINRPSDVSGCVEQYSTGTFLGPTGNAAGMARFLSILQNNLYVMIFTLIFSLIFGAGAIFILAWNATVIAGAVGVFTRFDLSQIPLGLFRYMIHGLPEIATYFFAALAGGMLGTGLVRNGFDAKKFVHVLQNALILLFIAIVVLIIAGLMEVYLTPLFF